MVVTPVATEVEFGIRAGTMIHPGRVGEEKEIKANGEEDMPMRREVEMEIRRNRGLKHLPDPRRTTRKIPASTAAGRVTTPRTAGTDPEVRASRAVVGVT